MDTCRMLEETRGFTFFDPSTIHQTPKRLIQGTVSLSMGILGRSDWRHTKVSVWVFCSSDWRHTKVSGVPSGNVCFLRGSKVVVMTGYDTRPVDTVGLVSHSNQSGVPFPVDAQAGRSAMRATLSRSRSRQDALRIPRVSANQTPCR